MTMTAGELRALLRDVPDETPVLLGDDFDEHGWDWLLWAGMTLTVRAQRLRADGLVEPAGATVLRLGSEPPEVSRRRPD